MCFWSYLKLGRLQTFVFTVNRLVLHCMMIFATVLLCTAQQVKCGACVEELAERGRDEAVWPGNTVYCKEATEVPVEGPKLTIWPGRPDVTVQAKRLRGKPKVAVLDLGDNDRWQFGADRQRRFSCSPLVTDDQQWRGRRRDSGRAIHCTSFFVLPFCTVSWLLRMWSDVSDFHQNCRAWITCVEHNAKFWERCFRKKQY